jgi:serine/threonine protein kinase
MVVDSEFLLNFRNEAQIIASLNHDCILKVYDFEERYKTVFIVTEYLEGESLRCLLMRLGKIPQLLAVKYILQICNGLAYAHGREIIHRDIHADNIMVLPGDRIKILDFGLACPVGTEDEQIGGMLAYQAPELLDGGKADRQSDIYALGITAFELITGETPFTTNEIMVIFQGNGQRVIPDPACFVPDILPALRRVILKACRHDKHERYHNITELINDLEPLLNLHLVNTLPLEEQHKSTTITFRCSAEQQQDFDRLLMEFSHRARDLGIDFDVYSIQDQTSQKLPITLMRKQCQSQK